MPDFVNIVTPPGRTISVPADQADAYIGSRPQTPEEADEAARARAEAEAYSGFGNAAAAAFLGAARMATGGLSDQYFGAVGGDETREELAKLKEHQGAATAVGEVAGAIAGPGKVAKFVGGAGKAAGTGARIVAHGVEGAVDGGLFSLGQTVSEAAIADEPINIEHLAANVGLGFVLGFGSGAGASGVIEGAGAVRKKLAGKANPLLHAQGAEAREMGSKLGGELKRIDQSLDDDKVWFDAQAQRGNEIMIDMLQGRRVGEGATTLIDNSPERAALVRDAVAAEEKAAALEAAAAKARDAAEKKAAQAAAKQARAEAQQLRRNLESVGKQAERDIAKFKPVPGAAPTRVEGMTEEMAAVAQADERAAFRPSESPIEAERRASSDAVTGGRPAPLDPNATNPGKRIRPKARLRPDEVPTQQQAPGPQLLGGANYGAESDKLAAKEVAELRAKSNAVRSRIAKVLGPDLNVHWPALVRKTPAQMIEFANDVDAMLDVANRIGKLARRDVVGIGSADELLSRIGLSEESVAGLKKLADKNALADVLGVDVGALAHKSPVADALMRGYAVSRTAETAAARKATVVMAERDSLKEQIKASLGGAVGGGIKAAAVGKVLGAPGLALMSLASLIGKNKVRLADGALAVVGKAAKAARKPSVPLASEVLSRVRFSDQEDTKHKSLAMRRSQELADLAANPRRAEGMIADHLAPIRAHNLNLGFAVEENLKRRLAYYHAVAPKAPQMSPLVRSRWQPSPGEEHEFAIRIRAGEDPLTLLEDVASGRVHPAAVETVRELYPEIYGQMQREIVEHLADLREDLPHAKRLSLSTMFEIPVDPTADPEFVKTLQDQYAARRQMEEQQQPTRSGGAPPAPPATKGQQLEAR